MRPSIRVSYAIIALLCIGISIASAQSSGDFRPKGTNAWVAGTWQYYDGNTSSWRDTTVVPSSANNITIPNGDTVTIQSSSGSCKNLIIQSGGVLNSIASGNSLTIYGGTIQCDGKLGTDTTTDAVMLQFRNAATTTLAGSGTVNIYRIRATTTTGMNFVFDMDANVGRGGGVYANNIANTTFTINTGRTLTLTNGDGGSNAGGYIGGAGSKTTAGTANYAIVVNGTLNVRGSSAINLNTSAATATLNINGTINAYGTGAINGYSGTSAISINSGGSLNAAGTAVCTTSVATTTIASGGTVDLSNSGLRNLGTASVSGKLRLADATYPSGTITLNSGSTVEYYGSSGYTMPALPTTYQNLQINNAGGITLGAGTTVNGTLTISNGALSIGPNLLTLNGDVSYAGGSLTGSAISDLTITGAGSFAIPSLVLGNLTLDRANGLSITGNLVVGGTLTLTNGIILTGSNTLAVSSGGSVSRTNGYVIGRLQKYVFTGTSVPLTLELGTVNGYSPVNMTFANVSAGGNFSGAIVPGDNPSIGNSGIDQSKSANEYWSFNSGAAIDSYDATLNFATADVDAGAIPTNFVARANNGSMWTPLTVGTETATSTQISGSASSGGIIALGEQTTDSSKITASAGPNGSISPSGDVWFLHGASPTFAITPGTGYRVDSVIVDGIKVDSTRSYTFINNVADHTIRAVFKVLQYNITATASPNGSINPSGSIVVDSGGTQVFTFAPITDYHVDSVIVNGVKVDSLTRYTFTNVTANQTIRVTFATYQYTISATSGPNGSIFPTGDSVVNYGTTIRYAITADAHYHTDSLLVDGVKVDSTVSYTFTNIGNNHTIRAVFAIDRFAIIASTGYGGSINPKDTVIVSYGVDTTFSITTNSGHRLDSVLVDGSNQGAITSYKFTSVATAHTIRAYFTTVFTLTLTQVGNGTITPVPNQAAYDTNSVVQLTANPAVNSFFVGWSGGAGGTTNPLNVTMNSNKTIKALFGTTITSNGTGGGFWNTGATWIGNVPPGGVDSAIVAGTDVVVVTTTPADSCGALIVQAGGNLVLDTILVVYGNTLVNGTVIDTANSLSTSIINTSGTITFGNGGLYRHGINAGTILTTSTVWGTGSTCMITGAAGTAPNPPAKGTKYFNYIWSCSGQSSNVNCGWDSVTVNGDLICAASGTSQWRMTSAANVRYIYINGNVVVTGGTFTASGSSGAALYNITVMGDIRLRGGIFNLCGGSGGYGLWKLNGNLAISDTASFVAPSNKTGYTRLMFTKKNGTQTYTNTSSKTNNNLNYGVDSNATVVLNSPLAVGTGTNVAALVMTSGKIVATSTNTLTLGANCFTYGQLDAVPTGSSYNYIIAGIKPIGSANPGFVEGPLRFTVASATQKVDSLPLGGGTIYRPTILAITQDAATSTVYSAELINSAPPARTLPGTLDSVSQARFVHIIKGTGANVSSATIQLSYDTNDLTDVSDKDKIRTAKDDGAGSWVNLGGSGTDNNTGVILSNAFGTSTGLGTLTTNDFIIAHVNPSSIPVPPTLTTDTVIYISTTFATSGGVITLDGNAAITAKGVCWNTTGTPTIANDTTNDGTTSAPFTSMLKNLTAGGTYYVRAYATNSAGTGYGNERLFTTLTALTGPTVVTDSVGNIVNTNAKGYGNVTAWGGAAVTDRGICWSTSHNPVLSNDFNSGGMDIGKFNAPIGGLTLGTTYYARAYAINSVDTSYGSEVSFVTPAPQPDVHKIVDFNGIVGVNCDYTDIQSAFDAVQSNYTGRWIIYVKKGSYYDKMTLAASKINVILIGESRDSTVLMYDDYAGLNRTTHGVTSDGTNTSYSVAIDAPDFQAQNLTIENTATYNSQAVALRTNGDRQAYYNCNILGRQDTYYTWGGSSTGPDRIYNKNCLITGSVDFIFGRDVAVFDSCVIYCNREGGTLTAAATELGYNFGYVFLNDSIASLDAGVIGFDGRPMVSFYLGRPWQSAPQTVYLNCYEPATLNTAGWTTMGPNPVLYSEYNCSGPGVHSRAEIWSGTHQPSTITSGQAATYTIANIFSKTTSRGSSTTSWWYSANWLPVRYTGPFTSVENKGIDKQIPGSYVLHQNYPNPFNPTTIISYDLPKTSKVSLKVYDTYGREVATLVNGIVVAGTHQEVFDGKNLASGVYFARLQTEVMSSTIKLVMIK